MTLDGRCVGCGDFSKPDEFGLVCVADNCVENQILNSDGTCSDCDDYYHPDKENKVCV
jgi:hypothetical protein